MHQPWNRSVFHHSFEQVRFDLGFTRLARGDQVIHLERAEPLTEVLLHPLKQWLLRCVQPERLTLFLVAFLADLDARSYRRRRDWVPVRYHEVGSHVIELLRAVRLQSLPDPRD